MRNFKQLKIWQKGFDIAVNSFKLTSVFPKEAVAATKKMITGLLKFRWARF
jgi:hypothetical protein